MPGFDMSDYVPVNERLSALYDRYPDASMQSEIVELTESRVTVKAYAYRSPDDQRPGIGHSSLEIPGKTSFTKGSEIENAETSAWGRAIAALGFEVKRGLASAEEVRNKQPQGGERPAQSEASAPKAATTRPAVQYRRDELANLMAEKSLDLKAIEVYANLVGIPKGTRATDEQMDALIDAVRGHGIDSEIDAGAVHAPTVGPERAASESTTEPEAGDSPSPASGPPPKPGTDDYKALGPTERAAARAYWQEHGEEPTLAEQLRVPAA